MEDTAELKEVFILRRTRATGGALLLPGKTYEVTKRDFLDLIRCGKGEDPSGKVAVAKGPKRKRNHGEAPGGKGESTETVATSKRRRKPAADKK